MTPTLYEGDNRIILADLIACGIQVHSVVTDPPYGLVSITKRFGSSTAAPAKHGKDGAFARLSRNFIGVGWDNTQIERDPEFWRLVYDILLPGGYCIAFSSTRTGHWQADAMEQAGFVMHPMIGWVTRQGQPKPHSAREAGEEWKRWAFGEQVLKPAMEPIYVGQRPFSEKNGPLNVAKHRTGAVNIDGCRTASGRYPTNLILDEHDEFFNSFPAVIHCPKATKADRAGSDHATVKPIALMQHLCRLVTPPGGTVLDPFAGSGTTGEAARLEGFDSILIEREPEYISDIKRRFGIA